MPFSGQLLKQHRTRLGLTQIETGRRMPGDRNPKYWAQEISKYERDLKTPLLYTAEKLAHVLGVLIDDLVEREASNGHR